MPSFSNPVLPLLAAWSCFVSDAAAQCQWTVEPNGHAPGANGTIAASVPWDPDGPGPLPVHVVIAGAFGAIGPTTTWNMAMRHPTTGVWSSLGAGVGAPNYVSSIDAMPNGELVVAASFSSGSLDGIGRWNGTSWTLLPAGNPSYPRAVRAMPNGDVLAGGYGGVTRWDGSTWTRLGPTSGGLDGVVNCIALAANGDVLAGGSLTVAGSPSRGIARWDGTAWSMLGGTSSVTSTVYTILPMPNGDVYLGGWLALASGPASVARWDGLNLLPVGNSPNGTVGALVELPGGNLLAAGQTVAQWDGVTWTDIGGGPLAGGVSTAQVLASGEVLVGGGFGVVAGVPAANLALWNGTTWLAESSGEGPNAEVSALAVDADGALQVGGYFTTIGGIPAPYLARHDGANWTAPPSPGAPTLAMHSLPNGDFVAGGLHVWQRHASGWTSLGMASGQPHSRVQCFANLADGTLIAGGHFGYLGSTWTGSVAQWDGSSWSPVGAGVWDTIYCLAVAADGSLIAGGNIYGSVPGTDGLLRWDGTTWGPVATGLSGQVQAMLVDRAGDLVVAGSFAVANGPFRTNVARLHNGVWTSLALPASMSIVNALLELPDGDLVAGGYSTTGDALLRYDGTAWVPFANAVYYSVKDLVLHGDELVVAGDLRSVGGTRVDRIARFATNCPATVSSLGAGCTGGSAPLTMDRPWLGSLWSTRGDGLPVGSLACAVLGFGTTALPLSTLVPIGRPGCSLLVSPDALVILPVVNGRAERSFFLPDAPSLVGVVLHEQWLVLDGTVDLAATEALTATLGAL
jgi:hypothetical protein